MIDGDKAIFFSVFSNPVRAWVLFQLLRDISSQLKEKTEDYDVASFVNLHEDYANAEKGKVCFFFNSGDLHSLKKISIIYSDDSEHNPIFTISAFEDLSVENIDNPFFKKEIPLAQIPYENIACVDDKIISMTLILLTYKNDLTRMREKLLQLGNVHYDITYFERKSFMDSVILYMNDYVDEIILGYLLWGRLSVGQMNGFESAGDVRRKAEMSIYRKRLLFLKKYGRYFCVF